MIDPLKEYLDQNHLSKENVLREVDEYSLLCHYIGVDLDTRTKYSSPIRQGDDDPSFSIYYGRRGNLMFKDSATGESGDIFTFLSLFFGGGSLISPRTVLLQINSDLNLGFEGEDVSTFKPNIIRKSPPKKKEPAIIHITRREEHTKEYLDYWNFLNVDEYHRKLYKMEEPLALHYTQDGRTSVVFPKSLCISYRIFTEYKIYQPKEGKLFKFRNNYKRNYVEGALQLTYKHDFCIITKATKECAFFRANFGWDAIASTSEGTLISPYFMQHLFKHFKYVFIWLDKDNAGIKFQAKYLELYPSLIPVVLHPQAKEKDPTDLFSYYKRQGKEKQVLDYIKQLIVNKLNG